MKEDFERREVVGVSSTSPLMTLYAPNVSQGVYVSKLRLQIGGSKDKTQLFSYKSPKESNPRRNFEVSISDLSQSHRRTPSEMFEDVLYHTIKHMHNHQTILIRSLLAQPITQ
jgi:hypothetical protein